MHHTCKVVKVVIILVALTMGIIISLPHEQGLKIVISVSKFFDVMIPALAVGALIKYLVCGGKYDCHKDQDVCKKD